MDPLVQEVWDSARRISCSWDDSYRKSISFQPFSVGMLAVEKGHDTSNVNCWMDIRSGRYPKTEPLEGITQIGEPLSILIFLSDKGENKFDVKAQDCWAYDSEYFDEPSTTKIQLTGQDGCPVKRKLIGDWEKTRQVLGNSGADLILYNIVNAFKFPDNAQVFITCNVEICRGRCDNECKDIPALSTTTRTPQITARPFQLIVKSTTPQPEVGSPRPKHDSSRYDDPNLITRSCGHGENDQRCRQPKIIDVKATEGLNLGTTEATQEDSPEENTSTGQSIKTNIEHTTPSLTEKIKSTRQQAKTKNIFFTTPKTLVVTPKLQIEEENGHLTTVTSKSMMRFKPKKMSEQNVNKEKHSKGVITTKSPRMRVKTATPKNLIQFNPSMQPFTPQDALHLEQEEEITTDHLRFNPNGINTKTPLFGPDSFKASPKMPSNMFVPVRPVGKQQTPRCEQGSKSPECAAVLVQNATFKTVKPFIRAEALRRPSSIFQAPLPPSVSPNCFPGSLSPSCHHHEACRKFPKDMKCQSYERCRMIARNPDCSSIICQISPNSHECKFTQRPKVALTKINKPCNASDPSCIVANFFLRPLNCDNNLKDPRCKKFWTKNPKQQFNAIVQPRYPANGNALRDQKPITQINLDAFCRNGNQDSRCKIQSNPEIKLKPSSINEKPNIIPKTTTEAPTTLQSKEPGKSILKEIFTKNKFGPNIPQISFAKTPQPINSNIFVGSTTERSNGNHAFNTTHPKERFKVTEELNTKPFVNTQIICNQNPFDARCPTIPRQPIQCIPGSDNKQCAHQNPFIKEKESNRQPSKSILLSILSSPSLDCRGLKCEQQIDGSTQCNCARQNCSPGSLDLSCQQIGERTTCLDGSTSKDCQQQTDLVHDKEAHCLLVGDSLSCKQPIVTGKSRSKETPIDTVIETHDCLIGSEGCLSKIPPSEPPRLVKDKKETIVNVSCILNPNLPSCKDTGMEMFGLVKENDPKRNLVDKLKPQKEDKKNPPKVAVMSSKLVFDPSFNQILKDPSDQPRQLSPIRNSKMKEPNIIDSKFTANPSKPNKEENGRPTSTDPQISGPRDPKTSLSVLNFKFPKIVSTMRAFPVPKTKILPFVKDRRPNSTNNKDRRPNSTYLQCSLIPCQSTDRVCQIDGSGEICFYEAKEPRCFKSLIECQPRSRDPAFSALENLDLLNCNKYPNDKRCRKPILSKTCSGSKCDIVCDGEECATGSTGKTNVNKVCNTGSSDMECKPNELDKEETRPKKDCIPGSQDQDCLSIDDEVGIMKNEKETCIPGSGDIRCWPYDKESKREHENNCEADSDKPECNKRKNTTSDYDCIPGTSDSKCKIQQKKGTGESSSKLCLEGSDDESCWPDALSHPKEDSTKDSSGECPPGSREKKCRENGDNPGKFDSIKTNLVTCTPGSKDPTCWPYNNKKQKCQKNSRDPNCFKQINRCAPGSLDPTCNTELKCDTPECLKSKQKENLILCSNDPYNPSCFIDKDQEEREKLCKSIPSNPICQTLNIVPTNQKIECSDDSQDPICWPVIQDVLSKEVKPSIKSKNAKQPKVYNQISNPNKEMNDPNESLKTQKDISKISQKNPTTVRKPAKPFIAFQKLKSERDKDDKSIINEFLVLKTKIPVQDQGSIGQQIFSEDPTIEQNHKNSIIHKVIRPISRKPKQFHDAPEPDAEPEPGDDYHSPGSNPRNHAFHSWLYQRIDPKVRAERRKKFFGVGRRKRQIPESLLEDIYGSTVKKMRKEADQQQHADSTYHAFHQWQRQELDPTKSSRRRKLLREGRSFAVKQQKAHSIAKRDSNSEKISINLGVKRITIDDSLLDILPAEMRRRTLAKQESAGTESHREVKYIMVANSTMAVAFCMFVTLLFLALFALFSSAYPRKRYMLRKL